ncbi:MAG TPA: PilC/PilY family type IV pilus protein [Syntrophales bacterium]|jgi:hypothetical protein|nr:hypothetical protein [Deltaproteobacteria bacterium]HNU84704.1 PilC/PilY family type IV pilus protein [Syntrophales bacterium]HNZ33963.1 PilC/PilY family type IV pilus protein [Syntrophales bacterium]HOF73124.1 PilC/PilY family type IV pilus protein [Syntrophales bacterium]HOH44402.1 PilC/PilY family type IV pilus protein [Syntrophales bacterium]
MKTLRTILAAMWIFLFCGAGVSLAQTCTTDEDCSETGLFTSVAPEAMILLDMSGSMKWNPPGDVFQCPGADSLCYYKPAGGNCATIQKNPALYSDYKTTYYPPWTQQCGNAVLNRYSNETCSGPFYMTKTEMPGYSTDCARYLIAREVIRKLLDDNKDGKIFTDDDTSLNIRMGFAKFQASTYQEWKPIGTSYRNIYCGAPFGSLTACTASNQYNYGDYKCILSSMWTDSAVVGATPLALALESVKTTLDTAKNKDAYKNCRQRFVILLSDGADTMACGAANGDRDSTQYKRRRASVARAKALADAGYKIFVIGFGANMPDIEKNTLNWMAYYGGTDNPLVANSGDKTALDVSAFEADPCAASATTGTCDGTSLQCFAASNDPGNTPLSGYAFIAGNATELEAGLREALNYIREANYAFSQSSVASSRIADENFLYEASFQPVNNDPMWLGHLRKYQILSDGTVGGAIWDAGKLLQERDPDTRVMKTYKGGALVDFLTSNITAADLGVENDTRRNEVVGYVRGEPTYNKDNWKLGDIFRANPVTVGTPSHYYRDINDGANAFATHRASHVRSSANGLRIVLSGANDGQLHAFRTSDGSEAWSFIPPSVVPKLRQIAHASHPAGMPHVYFVDGPISVADAWLGTGEGKTKSASDWKTLLVFGLGRGADPNLWSSSPDCLSDFSLVYDASRPHYCGYYALDITDTLNPAYKWRITPSSAQAPYLGDPYSKMSIGRVKVGGNEKWVGFMGGGHNWAACNPYDGVGTDCDKRGKGFFVIDLSNGSILWSYTRADNPTDLNYAMPAAPAAVDSDLDGFVDTVYIGDLNGQMWRFRFCSASDGDACGTANWTGSRLFQPSGLNPSPGPTFAAPTVAKDATGNLWVYWGTGDKTEPIVVGTTVDRFFAVKDSDLTSTWSGSTLDNITGAQSRYTDNAGKHGWYMNLSGSGEKVLGEATVFGGSVYFTTYMPGGVGVTDPCNAAGTAKLYGVAYIEGAGSLTGNARSITLGVGIPTAPTLSLNPYSPNPDLYVTVSGGSGTGSTTMRAPVNPSGASNRTNILHWRDRRVQ